MDISRNIKGVKKRKQWAVFDLDGNLIYRSISDTQKDAKKRTVGYNLGEELTWSDYASIGYTTNKILVDIKLI